MKWDRPSTEEINRVIVGLGGTTKACKLLKKSRTTVFKWQTGANNVDYPSWTMLKNELERVSKPLIKFINKCYEPHTKSIVQGLDMAEVVSGEMIYSTKEFVDD